jgi:ligand-binding SRPBCC domain-containing protein
VKFRFEQRVEASPQELFAFHEEPRRLELLHAGWSRVRVLEESGSIRPGLETWVEIMIAPLCPLVLGFEHFAYDPPHRFGERLIHGPFARFEHIHEFVEIEDGTLIRDSLQIELPMHYGGEMGMRFLAPRVNWLFHHRADAYLQLFPKRC